MRVRGVLESLTQSHRALYSVEISSWAPWTNTSVEFIYIMKVSLGVEVLALHLDAVFSSESQT